MSTTSAVHAPARLHLQALDILRGLSALAVFVAHFTQQHLEPGDMGWAGAALELLGVTGVAVFFVLSGFLIHMGALRERERHHDQLDWARYARRRFWRIAPAYVLALVVYSLASLELSSNMITPATWQAFVTHLFFVSSFVPGEYQSINAIFWTVVVEAHFYAMYPLLVALTRRWSPWATFGLTWVGGMALFVGGTALTDAGEVRVMWQHTAPVLFWKWTLGMLLAEVAVRGHAPWLRSLLSRTWLIAPVLLGIWAGTFFWQVPSIELNHKRFVLPFFCAALVGLFLFSDLKKWRSRVGEWLGDISYSVYLWHPLALAVTLALPLDGLLLPLLFSLALTLLMSHVSHRFVERPAMSFARQDAAPARGEAGHTVVP